MSRFEIFTLACLKGRRGMSALVIALSLAGLVSCGGELEQDAGRTMAFWRVESPENGAVLHILGSIPVDESSWLRFDPVIEQAYARAEMLVLPNNASLSPQNSLIGWKAHLAEGDALARWIPDEMHAEYTRVIGLGGFAAGTGEVTAPWFTSQIVEVADWQRIGFVKGSEFETYFVHRAQAESPLEPKEILTLEESAATYDRFALLSKELQIQMMRAALDRSETAAQTWPAAQRAWQRGDVAHLAKSYDAIYRDDPSLEPSRKATTWFENERLTNELERLLAEAALSTNMFAVVKTHNLVGTHGVLEGLRAAGLSVEQLESETGEGTLRSVQFAPTAAVPPERHAGTGRPRVLIVGIDGATLRIITPMIEDGRLPALAQLARDGASGPLRSHSPIHSPRIWNSISTGKTPENHGIEGFTYKDESGTQQLYLSVHRKAHALWNIASDAGLTVGVVNWWNTYPPEVVNGVMISDHAKPNRLDELRRMTGAVTEEKHGAMVYPVEWNERVAAAFGRRNSTRGVEDPFLGNVGIPPFMQREALSERYQEDDAVVRIAELLDQTETPDVLMVFLPGIDRVSHRLWGSLEPLERYPEGLKLSAGQRKAAQAALYRYYDYTDQLIGVLMRRFGPDDLVLVLSDHGFEAGELLGTLTGVHDTEAALDGILFARGPGISPETSTRGTSVNDITPTVLAWLGLPLGLDMDGRPAAFLEPPVEQPPAIVSHDVGEVERLGQVPSGNEEEILDQLRGLGYIE